MTGRVNGVKYEFCSKYIQINYSGNVKMITFVAKELCGQLVTKNVCRTCKFYEFPSNLINHSLIIYNDSFNSQKSPIKVVTKPN